MTQTTLRAVRWSILSVCGLCAVVVAFVAGYSAGRGADMHIDPVGLFKQNHPATDHALIEHAGALVALDGAQLLFDACNSLDALHRAYPGSTYADIIALTCEQQKRISADGLRIGYVETLVSMERGQLAMTPDRIDWEAIE